MKILHIITGLNIGGAEMMLLKLLAANKRLDGPAGEVISLRSPGPVAPMIEALGVRVHSAEMDSMPAALMRYRHLKAMIRDAAPDIVQCWMAHANVIGGAAAHALGVPVIWGLRQSLIAPGMGRASTRAMLRLGGCFSRRIPARIVCASEAARRDHEAAGYDPSKMEVIPNGFDLDVFRPDMDARADVRRDLGLGADVPLVGLIARVDPYKDHATFFAAAAIVARAHPGCVFVLAGGGADKDNADLAALIARHGLTPCTRLLGARSDVARLTAALDVAVSSSACGEAFSNTLGEALACGVPVAATDVGNAAELAGSEGRIVPPGDAAALGAAIDGLLSLTAAERTDISSRARARMERDYGLDAVARRWQRLYGEIG